MGVLGEVQGSLGEAGAESRLDGVDLGSKSILQILHPLSTHPVHFLSSELVYVHWGLEGPPSLFLILFFYLLPLRTPGHDWAVN